MLYDQETMTELDRLAAEQRQKGTQTTEGTEIAQAAPEGEAQDDAELEQLLAGAQDPAVRTRIEELQKTDPMAVLQLALQGAALVANVSGQRRARKDAQKASKQTRQQDAFAALQAAAAGNPAPAPHAVQAPPVVDYGSAIANMGQALGQFQQNAQGRKQQAVDLSQKAALGQLAARKQLALEQKNKEASLLGRERLGLDERSATANEMRAKADMLRAKTEADKSTSGMQQMTNEQLFKVAGLKSGEESAQDAMVRLAMKNSGLEMPKAGGFPPAMQAAAIAELKRRGIYADEAGAEAGAAGPVQKTSFGTIGWR